MLSDWLKTQKKPTRTNQIRAVLTTKIQENGHGFQQMTTGFNFVSKTTIKKLKKYSKNPNTVKKCVAKRKILSTKSRKMSQRN